MSDATRYAVAVLFPDAGAENGHPVEFASAPDVPAAMAVAGDPEQVKGFKVRSGYLITVRDTEEGRYEGAFLVRRTRPLQLVPLTDAVVKLKGKSLRSFRSTEWWALAPKKAYIYGREWLEEHPDDWWSALNRASVIVRIADLVGCDLTMMRRVIAACVHLVRPYVSGTGSAECDEAIDLIDRSVRGEDVSNARAQELNQELQLIAKDLLKRTRVSTSKGSALEMIGQALHHTLSPLGSAVLVVKSTVSTIQLEHGLATRAVSQSPEATERNEVQANEILVPLIREVLRTPEVMLRLTLSNWRGN